MKKNQDTAILFFTRTPRNEAAAKCWTSIPDLDYKIASTLIARTSENLLKAPFPVFRIDNENQLGRSFGEKLGNAFKMIFRKGFRYVIAVGNDCHQLNPNWTKIQHQLRSGKAVFGPDLRGGVYLLGISSVSDYEKIFKQISWNSTLVFDQLKTHFEDHYTIEPKRDINNYSDLSFDLQLYKLIKACLIKGDWSYQNDRIISSTFSHNQPLRAPPPSYPIHT